MKSLVTLFVVMTAAALLLGGCFDEPRLKADNQIDFQKTLEIMMNRLGPSDRAQLDASLKDIVLVKSKLYKPLLEASSYLALTYTFDTPEQNYSASLLDAAASIGTAMINTQWDANKAKFVVEYAQGPVNGHTAAEIVSIAANERKSALSSAVVLYQDQLVKAEGVLDDSRDAAKKQQKLTLEILSKIQLSQPRFSYRNDGFLDRPTISFSIANHGSGVVKRIFLYGTLETPGRSVPWVSAPFNYEIPGGLEPNETLRLDLAPNLFSAWGSVPHNIVEGAVLSLTLTALQDASGRRYERSSDPINDAGAREKTLQRAVQELKSRILTLQSQQ